jgi:hypothetical protein
MTDKIDVAGLRALRERATPGPWEYRPYEGDDWGFVRGPEQSSTIGPLKPLVAVARPGHQHDFDADAHRRAGADPYEPNAALITAAVNALPALLDAAEATAALEWFGTQHRLSLDFYSPVYGDDDDQSQEWRVTKESGSINDREWDVIGRGETPLAAITAARAALPERPQ